MSRGSVEQGSKPVAPRKGVGRASEELQRENNNLAQQLKVLEAEVLNFMEAKGYLRMEAVGTRRKRRRRKRKRKRGRKRRKRTGEREERTTATARTKKSWKAAAR